MERCNQVGKAIYITDEKLARLSRIMLLVENFMPVKNFPGGSRPT